MSTKLGCPNCLKPLVRSKDTCRYETTEEHVCDPNGDSPERTYLYCPNKDCCLRDGQAFWADYGEFYGTTSEMSEWWQANRIDSFDHTTFKRIGAEAIGSFSREFNDSMVKERRYWWRRLKQRLRNRWGNWGVDLRCNYCPYLFKPRTGLKARVAYAFGVWIMDPWGRWKPYAFGRRDPDDICVKQWLHHPFPWISRRALNWIKSLQEEEEVCP